MKVPYTPILHDVYAFPAKSITSRTKS